MIIKRSITRELYSLLGAMVLGVILNILLVRTVKQSVLSDFKGIKFYLPIDSDFNSTLYYSFSDKFTSEYKIDAENTSNRVLNFNFSNIDSIPTNFRLDFGNDTLNTAIILDSMAIVFSNHSKVLSQKELFTHVILHSAAVKLDKKEGKISFNPLTRPFDPYIVFDPLVKIIAEHHPLKWVTLLGPFLIFIGFNLKRWYSVSKSGVIEVLCMVFIFCIPLKIAWTTFITLLICAYGIILAVREKRFDFKNPNALLLLALFLLLLIFGRATSLKVIDHQLALVLFYFIIATLRFNRQKITGFYIYFMLVLNAVLVTTGVSFLFSFHDIFGLGVLEYFLDIKTYSGNIREWLYYDHAVFLTFFGLVGLLFVNNLLSFQKKFKGFIVAYHVLLISTILLVGARISLLIYLVFLANLALQIKSRSRIWINTAVFLSVLILLFRYIGSIDDTRQGLWSVSWQAIKEKPFLGYGLGSSDQVLHQRGFMEKVNTAIPAILNHSHNQFLTFLLEIGFIGTSALVLIIAVYLKQTVRYKSKTTVLFIFGLCYVFLTESILQTSKPLFVLCFLFALLTGGPISRIPNELDNQP
ncbi:MAG: O-antigen ligase [Maribacter sp.]|jgi:O-antigen ligase